jgi:hypothetical protein
MGRIVSERLKRVLARLARGDPRSNDFEIDCGSVLRISQLVTDALQETAHPFGARVNRRAR